MKITCHLFSQNNGKFLKALIMITFWLKTPAILS
jgi:hypothetical protein